MASLFIFNHLCGQNIEKNRLLCRLKIRKEIYQSGNAFTAGMISCWEQLWNYGTTGRGF
jgi:hypothetical protein